jgi:predicted Zn finger-like uncharacterized protein
MILVCPNCDARYRLADDAIPERGRKVRCANCQHEWVEAPPAAVPPPEPAPAVEPTPFAPLTAEPVPEAEPEPAPRRGGWLKTLVALVLAAALGVAAVAIWGAQWGLDVDKVRVLLPGSVAAPAKPVAREVPLLVSFTARLDKLPSGASLLSVTGDVTNPTAARQPVPPLDAVLHDAAERPVYRWQVKLPVTALDPGSTVTFDTSASNFTAGAANLSLEFKPGPGTAR